MPRAHHYSVGTNPACLLLSQTYTAERFSSLERVWGTRKAILAADERR